MNNRDTAMPAPSLGLLVLYSKEPDESAAFYGMLGMTFKKHRHGSGPEHYAAELPDGCVLEIYPAGTREPIRSRIGFRVADVDSTVEHLRSQGVAIQTDPQDSEWGYHAVAVDPQGIKAELLQAPEPPVPWDNLSTDEKLGSLQEFARNSHNTEVDVNQPPLQDPASSGP